MASNYRFTEEECHTVHPDTLLRCMLSMTAVLPMTSVPTLQGPFETQIGKGQCGTVYTLGIGGLVKKTPNSISKIAELRRESQSHMKVLKTFYNAPEALSSKAQVPRLYALMSPPSSHTDDEPPDERVDILSDYSYGIVSRRIFPLHDLIATALLESLVPTFSVRQRETCLSNPTNNNFLARLYLGRRGVSRSKARAEDMNLRNFPLHVDEMERLCLPIPAYITTMAQSLALMHWKAGIDANDVEFVFGDSIQNSTDRDGHTVSVWLLDFNQCRRFSHDQAGLKQLVDAFWWNDPYYPRPSSPDPQDRENNLHNEKLGIALGMIPSFREAVTRYTGISAPGGVWRILAIFFALLSIKSLPFVWHFRVFKNLIWQFKLQPIPLAKSHLYAPVITTSHNSISECDYNFHKSNSTYFADLDVSRAAFVGVLLKKSLARLNSGDLTGLPEEAKTTKASYIVALGGVGCVFRKEIPPLAKYEVWTRLLSWDEKWIYLVSHIVKRGAKKPSNYFLQSWRNGKGGKKPMKEGEDKIKSIYATSIAKYVVKRGRLTIAPEIVLRRSDLLPERPANQPAIPTQVSDTPTPEGGEKPYMSSPENLVAQVMGQLRSENMFDKKGEAKVGEMTWKEVEAKRLRGLEIAQHFDGLTALHGEWNADDNVLGEYGDFFW
ncbi:4HBT like protein, partial [Aureobasidium melanogenum]